MTHIEERIDKLEKEMEFLFEHLGVEDCPKCWGSGRVRTEKNGGYRKICGKCDESGLVIVTES